MCTANAVLLAAIDAVDALAVGAGIACVDWGGIGEGLQLVCTSEGVPRWALEPNGDCPALYAPPCMHGAGEDGIDIQGSVVEVFY